MLAMLARALCICDLTPQSEYDRSQTMLIRRKRTALYFGLPWFSVALLCPKRIPNLIFWGIPCRFCLLESKATPPNSIEAHEAPFLYDKNIHPDSLMGTHFERKYRTVQLLCYNVVALTKSSACVPNALQSG